MVKGRTNTSTVLILYLSRLRGLFPCLTETSSIHSLNRAIWLWDDLWLEQGDATHFVVVAKRSEKEQVADADKAAIHEVCNFFMRMKLNTRLFQRKFDWQNPGPRLTTVLDKANREATVSATVTPARKSSKKQRRSSAGIGRDSSGFKSGLASEWNLEVGSSWVWNDNQEEAANSNPKLLTRQRGYLSF